MPSADIFFDESVLAFILGLKPRKFHYHKKSNTLVTPYCIVFGVFCPILKSIRVWGMFICGKRFLGRQFR